MNVGVSDGGERSSSGSGGGGGIPAAVAGHTDVQDLTDVTPTHFFSNLRSFPLVVLLLKEAIHHQSGCWQFFTFLNKGILGVVTVWIKECLKDRWSLTWSSLTKLYWLCPGLLSGYASVNNNPIFHTPPMAKLCSPMSVDYVGVRGPWDVIYTG